MLKQINGLNDSPCSTTHKMTECEGKKKGAFVLLLLSPGDAAVVQPLLSSHYDVEPAAKVVWLHIHDLMTRHVHIIKNYIHNLPGNI